MTRKKISVLITTLNEEQNLPGCLESVHWADDVLVVDSNSQDNTVTLAQESGARVLIHAYENAGHQKNWALQHIYHDWVLILDADERLTPALQEEIIQVLEGDGPADGYFLRRQSFFLGRAIRHCGWERDRVLRLFRKDLGRYDDRFVHEKLHLQGKSIEFSSPLLHYTYRSFSDYLERLNQYTRRGAKDLHRQGHRPSMLKLLLRPPARFIRMYFLQRGFLDGVSGLLLCTLASYSVWLKYARMFEPELIQTEKVRKREEAIR